MCFNKSQIFSCIDVETTGLNKSIDRIIQLSITNFQVGDELGTYQILESKNWYIKPSGHWQINLDAYYIHNISEEFIQENGVSLKSIYDEFIRMIDKNYILTYNGSLFDIQFIQKEFEREMLDTHFQEHHFVDSYDIEKRLNSNKLSEVYKRYFGEDFENAHDSSADVLATIRIFNEQVKRYKLQHDTQTSNGNNIIEESIDATTQSMQLSPEGFVYIDDNGVLKFKIGKFKEYPVIDVCKNNPSYIKWLFTPNNGDNIITNITKKTIKENYYKEMKK